MKEFQRWRHEWLYYSPSKILHAINLKKKFSGASCSSQLNNKNKRQIIFKWIYICAWKRQWWWRLKWTIFIQNQQWNILFILSSTWLRYNTQKYSSFPSMPTKNVKKVSFSICSCLRSYDEAISRQIFVLYHSVRRLFIGSIFRATITSGDSTKKNYSSKFFMTK